MAPHELAHGTVFRTRRLNRVFLYLYSLLSWWDPFDYGTSHTYHHRYTLYPEGDRENLLPLHPSVGRTFLLQMFTLNLLTRPGRNFTKGGLLSALAITVLGAFGLIGSTRAPIRQWIQALHLDQPAEAWKSMWWSRAQLLFHGAVAVVGIASGLWVLPLVISAAPPAAPLRRPNMFMYEDMHWHEEIETWMWLPQARRAIKVDDYTVRLETDVPYPVLDPEDGGAGRRRLALLLSQALPAEVAHPLQSATTRMPTRWPRRRASTPGSTRSATTSGGIPART